MEIYGTLGPSCNAVEMLRRMFAEGMTGMRLNLSHVTLRESAEMIDRFHHAASAEHIEADLLIDMQGPEMRLGKISKRTVSSGEKMLMGKDALPIPKEIAAAAQPGDILQVDDGKLRFYVESVQPDCIEARCLTNGVLQGRKSIAIEGRNVTGPVLTDEDLLNLREAKNAGVTTVMQPFVRHAEDLFAVRQTMQACGCGDCRLFAKIENQEGLDALSSLLPRTDMIVIARGDLGNAVPLPELTGVQKDIAKVCLKAKTPFMVVTQMLASMEKNPVPTRAEVSDIFNAVLDGASAVMVTGETAAGLYPVEVIRVLTQTVEAARQWSQKFY